MISIARRSAPSHFASSDGRSWPVASWTETGSSTPTRTAPKSPLRVMYAAIARNTSTTTDLRLPPPTRISVFEPHPDPSVMPMPNSNPPTTYESQVKFGPG